MLLSQLMRKKRKFAIPLIYMGQSILLRQNGLKN